MNTFVDFTVSRIFLSPQKAQQQQNPTYPSQPRLLAIGDLYDNLQKAKQALKMEEKSSSSFIFLEELKQDAEKSNGKVLILQGNHESLNIQGDFKYVIQASLDEFKNCGDWFSIGTQIKNLCKGLEKQINIFNGLPKNYPSGIRARIAALSPRGPISIWFLADNPTVLMVGGSVFVHVGILRKDGVPRTLGSQS
ncbi:hypothetical protein AMTRI_Chr07g26790 [Amborella trichopoda]